MRNIKVPNLVMLLDILFVLVFILILNPEGINIEVDFVDNKLPKNALVYLGKDTCYDTSTQTVNDYCLETSETVKLSGIDSSMRAFSRIKNLPSKVDVAFSGNTYKNIAKSFFDECFTKTKNICNGSTITLHIREDGTNTISLNDR